MVEIYAFAWDYDLVGNRTYQRDGALETYYEYDDGNALVQSVEGGEYSYFAYDSRGNCTQVQESDGTIYFSYNHANLVTEIKYKDGVENRFWYDAMLRRYAMEDSAGLRYFTWDQNGVNLLTERDSSGEVTAEYVHGDTPIEGIGSMVTAKKNESGATYYQYPVYDHRGTVYRLTDENGNVTEELEYNAWGQVLEGGETGVNASNRFSWQSNWIELKDSGGDLLISPARVYSAGFARFLQRDPIQMLEVFWGAKFYENSNFSTQKNPIRNYNLYRGFKNNPVEFVDPRGDVESPFDPPVVIVPKRIIIEPHNREDIVIRHCFPFTQFRCKNACRQKCRTLNPITRCFHVANSFRTFGTFVFKCVCEFTCSLVGEIFIPGTNAAFCVYDCPDGSERHVWTDKGTNCCPKKIQSVCGSFEFTEGT